MEYENNGYGSENENNQPGMNNEYVPEQEPQAEEQNTAAETEAANEPSSAYSYTRSQDSYPGNGAYRPDVVQQPSQQQQYQTQPKQPPYTYVQPVKVKKSYKHAVVSALIFGVIASVLIGGTMFVMNRALPAKTNIMSVPTSSSNVAAEVTDTDLSAIVDSAMPSIVSITNKSVSDTLTFFGRVYEQEQVGAGSGIIYGSNETELLIVTNYHVVADSKELKVYFGDVDVSDAAENGQTSLDSIPSYDAALKGSDPDLDLAVIAVKLESIPDDVMSGIVFAAPGDSTLLKAGQRVIAIGNALGYGQSVTTGIISATDRKVTMQNSDGVSVTNSYIQTDAAINPGNSGGALLNLKGELIGINSAKIVTSGVEGMGYAIPISDVKDIIGELLVSETREVVDEADRGSIGIEGSSISQEVSDAYGLPVGVNIRKVYKDSAAEKAGLKEGYVITKIGKSKVRTIEELQKQLSYYKAGESVTLTVQVRGEDGYTEKEVEVVLDPRSKLEESARAQTNK